MNGHAINHTLENDANYTLFNYARLQSTECVEQKFTDWNREATFRFYRVFGVVIFYRLFVAYSNNIYCYHRYSAAFTILDRGLNRLKQPILFLHLYGLILKVLALVESSLPE